MTYKLVLKYPPLLCQLSSQPACELFKVKVMYGLLHQLSAQKASNMISRLPPPLSCIDLSLVSNNISYILQENDKTLSESF